MPQKAVSDREPGRMLNAEQAAKILGVSSRNVYSMAAPAGPIPCYRIGKRLCFDERDLQAYKESCRCVPFKMPTPTSSMTIPKLKSSPTGFGPGGSDLEKTFLKLGIKLKRTRTIGRTRRTSNEMK